MCGMRQSCVVKQVDFNLRLLRMSSSCRVLLWMRRRTARAITTPGLWRLTIVCPAVLVRCKTESEWCLTGMKWRAAAEAVHQST